MNLASRQLHFDLYDELSGVHSSKVAAAIEKLSVAAGTESRGAVFTRTEVVDFVLDLVGYTQDKPLHKSRLLEPSFGGGDFLLPLVGRLLVAWRATKSPRSALDDMGDAIRAVELHRDTFQSTRAAVVALLEQEGLAGRTAVALANRWLTQGDFLLTPIDGQFDFVVGNPPYVRQEMIPAPLDAPKSRAPVKDRSPHFPIFDEFKGASYLNRYDLLCQRLVQEQLYTTATVIASHRSAAKTGKFSGLSEMTGLKTFVTSLAGHIAAEASRLG